MATVAQASYSRDSDFSTGGDLSSSRSHKIPDLYPLTGLG